MALQELRAPPAITGYGDLANVLLQGSHDYMNQQLLERERHSKREEALQDQATKQAFDMRVLDKEHANAIDRLKQEHGLNAHQQFINILVSQGYLSSSDINDSDKVKVAAQRAQSDGTLARMGELLSTPGPDGKPLLTPKDVNDPQKVQAAQEALGGIKASAMQFGLDQRGASVKQANALAQQASDIQGAINQTAQKLNSLPTSPRVFTESDPEVTNAAAQLVAQSKGNPKDQRQIDAQKPLAIQALNQQSQQQFILGTTEARKALTEQLNGYHFSLKSVTDQIDHLKISPTVNPTASGSLLQSAPDVAGPKVASPADIAAAMKAALGGAPAASGPSVGQPLDSNLQPLPGNDPIIQQENARRASMAQQFQQQNQLQGLQAAQARVADLSQKIDQVKRGHPAAFSRNLDNPNAPDLTGSGSGQAELLSNLYQQLAQAQKDLEAQQSSVPGGAPPVVKVPSDASGPYIPSIGGPPTVSVGAPTVRVGSPAPVNFPIPQIPQQTMSGALLNPVNTQPPASSPSMFSSGTSSTPTTAFNTPTNWYSPRTLSGQASPSY